MNVLQFCVFFVVYRIVYVEMVRLRPVTLSSISNSI